MPTIIRLRHAWMSVALLLALAARANAQGDNPISRAGGDVEPLQVDADRLSGLAPQVLAMAFSSDSKTLAIGHSRASLALWDIAGRRASTTEPPDHEANPLGSGFIGCLAFSPDGQTLACGVGDDCVVLWDVGRRKTRTLLRPRGRPTGPVRAVSFSADGRWLVKQTFAAVPGVELWSVRTRRPVLLPRGYPPMLSAAAFSPDGKTLAYGGWGTIRLWDLQKRRLARQLANESLRFGGLAFFDEGRRLATAAGPSGVRHVDIRTGEVAVQPEVQDPVGAVQTFAWQGFSPDGSHCAMIPTGGGLRVWDVAGRAERKPFWNAEEKVSCVAFSPDGKWMATSAVTTGSIRLWEIPPATDF